jgi:RNase H-fold protein (predicted Holliday junction resolvase)
MTNEEMQRTMEFILNQQAQLAASQQKAEERAARLEDIIGKLAAATLTRFEAVEGKVAEQSEDFDRKIAALIDAQMRTEEELNKTNEAVRNLTAVVDRYFRERNGRKDSE